MIVCDSCGAPADDRHVRERIERLELATRFRPIHIQTLLLDAAPPTRTEDYFYRVGTGEKRRSEQARRYFDGLTGFRANPGSLQAEEEAGLDAFQRRGLFLAYLVECPMEDPTRVAAAVRRTAPILLKRLERSYRPKGVAIVSPLLGELIPALEEAGWRDRLILDGGKPFSAGLADGLESGARLIAALARAGQAG